MDYQPGEVAHYQEDGGIMGVEIVENNSDDEWERYRLRVLEVIRRSPLPVRTLPPGAEFDCEKRRNVHIPFALWELSDRNRKQR